MSFAIRNVYSELSACYCRATHACPCLCRYLPRFVIISTHTLRHYSDGRTPVTLVISATRFCAIATFLTLSFARRLLPCFTFSLGYVFQTHPPDPLSALLTIVTTLKTNFAETKSIARTRLQSTIAVSRLTGTVKDFSYLTASLGAVTNYSKRDARNSQIQTETEGLCKRLLEVFILVHLKRILSNRAI